MITLIIDDDPIVRMLASKMLEVKGYNINLAPDKRSLIDFLNNNDDCPDLILLDLQVGDMMGPEAYDLILAKYKVLKKIICMSSHASHEAESLFPELKTKINLETNFLQKPFIPAQLYEALNAS